MTSTTPTLNDQLAAARAETARLQQLQDKIDAAGAEASNAAMLQHYRHAATERAREYRERRDALKIKLDKLAVADKLNLDDLFTAYVALRDDDARCGALNIFASMVNSLEPQQPNAFGVHPMPRGAHVAELYGGWTFTSFLDQVIARRADAIRAHHGETLRAEAHKEVSAAEQQARDAAAAAG
jgi:hypothetical protein